MQRFESNIDLPGGVARKATSLGGILLFCWLVGCGTSTTDKTAASTASSPTYFAPYIQGVSDAESPQTFTIDDAAGSFSQIIYQPQNEAGLQVLNSGTLTVGQRGLRSMTITVNYAYSNETGTYEPNTTPQVGSFAVELAGQAGGLVQLVAQPAEPVVAATQCPGSSSQTYQFITIPTAASPTFLTETAYGSVDISSSGTDVTLKNIHQYTLPSGGQTGTSPAQPSASTMTGVCGPTFFGNITTVPGQLVVTDPGLGSVLPAQAEIGIGPSGLLVENDGFPPENVLGAGTGAVGLPQPLNALDTSTVVGAQYLGFIYAAGVGSPYLPWSSHLASFGFSSMPSSCASVPASTSPSAVIYGGDFPQSNGQDNPSASPDGFGNCDFAIDLGSQDSNGLYSNAIVWVYPGYAGNTTGKRYSFPAVAISGQLNGKYAVFLIGYDSMQPWAVYLLQSNN